MFEQEINNIPQSLCVDGKNSIELYHGSKSEITKRFHSPTTVVLSYELEAKSSIVIEMSQLIKTKAFATHNDRLTNFVEFFLLVYYEVKKYGTNYDRIDLVFDRYFEKSVKEGTRSRRGEGSQYLFEGDSTEIPFKMADTLLKSSENKDKLNEYLATKLLELHQGDQILVVTYKNTALTSQPSCPELDQHFPVRPCEAEEADQRLERHTLNLIHNGYKNILVRTIDTDVLVLLISHIGRVELGDVDIHAYLIDSEIYYGIRATIQELESTICRALPFFYALSGCETVLSFYGKGKCKAYDVWLKSS